jgi:NADPH:quinone reductase-like Zn-dependent oxidoreductase
MSRRDRRSGPRFLVGRRVIVLWSTRALNTPEDEFTRRGEDSLSPGYAILGEQVRGGTAEFLAISDRNLHAMPAGWEFASAAAPLLVSLAAWRMLIHRAKLRAGESVLVVGAGGGVNSMAIQIAKLAGATVYVVCRNEKAEKRKPLVLICHRSKQGRLGKRIYALTESGAWTWSWIMSGKQRS